MRDATVGERRRDRVVTEPAIVFDLDGVLIDSESIWDRVRKAYVESVGGTWREDSQRVMMGMSTQEWSAYLTRELGVPAQPPEAAAAVIEGVAAVYGDRPPLLRGAQDAVRSLAAHYTLGLASSSPRRLIDVVLRAAGLADAFSAIASTEELARGKPAPDVYLEAARRLSVEPERCVAVEDSSNGLRAAAAAGMHVVAIPNRHYPPDPDALGLADVCLAEIGALTPGVVAGLLRGEAKAL
jgi:HAD superfamily hydrolase (TIGR01509 family)